MQHRHPVAIAVGTVVGLLLIVALVIGGWQLGWWLKKESVNRNTKISNDSFARQQSLRQDVINKYTDVRKIDVQIAQAPDQASVLNAQRQSEITGMCFSFRQLTDRVNIDPAIQEFAAKECA